MLADSPRADRRVGHAAPDCTVRRSLEVRVGEHDHRVLAAELETAGDQPLGSAPSDPPACAGGAGELDVVGLVHQRGAGVSRAGQAFEHPRSTQILMPGTDDLAGGERGELRRLDGDRRSANNAGTASASAIKIGKFHGQMTPTTGYGR
jgi:hypothetical protein